MNITEQLLDIYEDLIRKNTTFKKALSLLDVAEDSVELFTSLFERTEIAIVLSMGGSKENWEYIDSDFFNIFYRFSQGDVDREKVKKEISSVIDQDFKGETATFITRG